jgi:hypothetical protein
VSSIVQITSDVDSGPAPVGHAVSLQQENRLMRETNLGKGAVRGFSYFLTRCVALPHDATHEIVERALQILVDRHESLRTAFRHDGEQFRQFVVTPAPAVHLLVHDAPTHAAAVETLREAYAHPFPPDTELFLRALLLQHAPGRSTLVIIIDHMVGDEAGLQNLINEFHEIYASLGAGHDVLAAPEARLQFKEWAAAQRAALAQSEEDLVEFWRTTLGADGPFPSGILFDPMDGVERARVQHVAREWDESMLAKVADLAARHRMSRFMVLLAVTQIATMIASEQDDIVVHSATSNRTTEEAMAMVGWCAHGLPFRLVAPADATVQEVLLEARQNIMDVFRHQDLPLTRIVKALTPSAHGSARSLRPPRFYFGYYDTSGRGDEFFHFDESEIAGAAEWAQPGLSIDVTIADKAADVRLHYGEGRMDPKVIAGIADLMGTTLSWLATTPDSTLAELRERWASGDDRAGW